MLRISVVVESIGRLVLKLEGNVEGEGSGLLEREWAALAGGNAIVVDMTAVRFVDRAGTEALRRLERAGVEIRCRPGVVASVLQSEGIDVVEIPSD